MWGFSLIFKIKVFFGEERNMSPKRKTFSFSNSKGNSIAAGLRHSAGETQKPLCSPGL